MPQQELGGAGAAVGILAAEETPHCSPLIGCELRVRCHGEVPLGCDQSGLAPVDLGKTGHQLLALVAEVNAGELLFFDLHHLGNGMALQTAPFDAGIVMHHQRAQTDPFVPLQQPGVGLIATNELEQKLGAGADVVVQHDNGPLASVLGAVPERLNRVEVPDGETIRLSVDIGGQIAAFAGEGPGEVDVAEPIHIESVVVEVHAQALVQQAAFADHPRPAVQLHALQQPHGCRLIVGWELVHPAMDRRLADLRLIPGLRELPESLFWLVHHSAPVVRWCERQSAQQVASAKGTG